MSIAVAALSALLLLAVDSTADSYPAAAGFNEAASDPEALAIADATMQAMGGYKAWDQTRFITWRFFGGRRHIWDKWTGDLRFEQDDLTVLMNINTQQGRAWRGGQALGDEDLQSALERGYRSWINDAYWLVMPYKLKDSGVTLRYIGNDAGPEGTDCHVVELTFAGVGVTPQNKYRVWVDAQTDLVSQWAFYPQANDEQPRFVGPWQNWQRYGSIMLSDGRGERGHTGLAVFSDLPASVMNDPKPVDENVLAQ
jgi:hypothetical protein